MYDTVPSMTFTHLSNLQSMVQHDVEPRQIQRQDVLAGPVRTEDPTEGAARLGAARVVRTRLHPRVAGV